MFGAKIGVKRSCLRQRDPPVDSGDIRRRTDREAKGDYSYIG